MGSVRTEHICFGLLMLSFGLLNGFASAELSSGEVEVSLPPVYSVHLEAFIDGEQAAQAVATFTAASLYPVWIDEDPPVHHVCFGLFSLRLEAESHVLHMRERGLSHSAEVITLAEEPSVRPDLDVSPNLSVFGLAVLPELSMVDGFTPPVSEVRVIDRTPTYIEVSEGVVEYREEPWIGPGGEEGRRPERIDELDSLLRTVCDEASASPRDRLNDCWNAVQALRADGRYPEAYAGVVEIEGCMPIGSGAAALCAAERVRLLLEVARGKIVWAAPESGFSGIGTMIEVRNEALEMLSHLSGSSDEHIKADAMLQLTVMETYFFDREFEEARLLGEEFLSQNSESAALRREIGVVLLRLGQIAFVHGDNSSAQQRFLSLLTLDLAPEENFEGMDVSFQAAGQLFDLARSQGDINLMELSIWYMEDARAVHPLVRRARQQFTQITHPDS
ncbi:hypothetical protein JXA47_09180 [Candidatus Sumerlaeota bacterium]|nr:hypothetical protein [Candidatus Sumerlaeota bacterium]